MLFACCLLLIISSCFVVVQVLIANRGEIAIRVIKACKELGVHTIAVYSEADRKSLFVKKADEAIFLGGAEASESYLNQDKLIQAAKRTHAEAIHPGYGFLSENASFAERCEKEGIIFIGPTSHTISKMGSKIGAKQLLSKAAPSIPLIPGYQGAQQDTATLVKEAQRVGYPILVKASAGGGGRGMRVVNEPSALAAAIEAARREAKGAFGDDSLLIERYFDDVRHIEVQIIGDHSGCVVHCFERECTIQRRHQKIVEVCDQLNCSLCS
jgi:3-methylcrotonyl-CoA carboxylase alpha subunit